MNHRAKWEKNFKDVIKSGFEFLTFLVFLPFLGFVMSYFL